MATWHCKKCGASGYSEEVMGHVSFDPGECPECGYEFLPVFDEVVEEDRKISNAAEFLNDLKSEV
jgi:C4-type Zn-finger protein